MCNDIIINIIINVCVCELMVMCVLYVCINVCNDIIIMYVILMWK